MSRGFRMGWAAAFAFSCVVGSGCSISTELDPNANTGPQDGGTRDGADRDRVRPRDVGVDRASDVSGPDEDVAVIDAALDQGTDAERSSFCDGMRGVVLCLDFEDSTDIERITLGSGPIAHEVGMVGDGLGALRTTYRSTPLPVGVSVAIPTEEVWMRSLVWVSRTTPIPISYLALSNSERFVLSSGMGDRSLSAFSNITGRRECNLCGASGRYSSRLPMHRNWVGTDWRVGDVEFLRGWRSCRRRHERGILHSPSLPTSAWA